MTVSLDLLRTFLAVHRTGSVTAAAHTLRLSQPAVSAQVKALEAALDRRLFDRLPRGVAPTPAADELARRLAAPLDALAEAVAADLDPEASARAVHLGGPAELVSTRVVHVLAPLVARGLRLRVELGLADDLLDRLAAGTLDLVVSAVRPRRRGVHATPLVDEEFVLVAAPHWAARAGLPGSPPPVPGGTAPEGPGTAAMPGAGGGTGGGEGTAAEPGAGGGTGGGEGTGVARVPEALRLAGVPVVAYAEDLPVIRRYWRTVFGTRPAMSAALVMPDLRGVRGAVVAGAGMSVLPLYLCEDELAEGTLVRLAEPELPPINTLFLAVREGAAAQRAVAAVRDHLLRWGRSAR
ncbi:LysR family transcriptional regulator [Planomonospora sp. ID91781]|uniref:LysR family transcriptional regulator n=1 Tax=Planomonospora sp. ID91781 TaxID=2738135 RepID=UPI001A2FC5C9|nr:LysR family transcriptional regulator [Planomonospora sp. ID91781]MBG0820775.1 LysR family transcriptional regulator [Planomonospora sp. ID91781]